MCEDYGMSLLHFNHSVLLLFSLCTPLHLLYSCHVMSAQAAGAQVPIALIIMAHQLFDMVVVTSNVHIEIIDRLSPALKSVICQLLKGTVHFKKKKRIEIRALYMLYLPHVISALTQHAHIHCMIHFTVENKN